MNDLKQRILERAEGDLAGIELALEGNLAPYLDLVHRTARHILFSGGKRLRPLLMVLSARLCGYRGDQDKKYSTIFEYLHAATLLHDDIVDDASVRRGVEVAHSVYGSAVAVLVGDYLLARALSIAADTGNIEIIRIIARITESMSQGEIEQLANRGAVDLSEEVYMETIRNKTAGLIEGACRVGALVAGAGEKAERRLAEYGRNMGIAFQMADDLLDYLSDTAVLGKAVGADLREGKLTLPVIVALGRAGEKDRKKMIEIIRGGDFSESDFGHLVDLLDAHGGIAYTRERAAAHVRRAKEALDGFDPSESKETLMLIADYALARKL